MKKKQSSIDWFVEQMIKEISKKFSVELTPLGLELIEQANAMHKEEIKKAWEEGFSFSSPYQSAEIYYNETYGGGKETK